jgi:hypothetical protein
MTQKHPRNQNGLIASTTDPALWKAWPKVTIPIGTDITAETARGEAETVCPSDSDPRPPASKEPDDGGGR